MMIDIAYSPEPKTPPLFFADLAKINRLAEINKSFIEKLLESITSSSFNDYVKVNSGIELNIPKLPDFCRKSVYKFVKNKTGFAMHYAFFYEYNGESHKFSEFFLASDGQIYASITEDGFDIKICDFNDYSLGDSLCGHIFKSVFSSQYFTAL